MDNNKTIDDIIAILDGFTSKNGGHMNIQVNSENIDDKKIDIANSLDCSNGDMAC